MVPRIHVPAAEEGDSLTMTGFAIAASSTARRLITAMFIASVSGCGGSGPGTTANPTVSSPPTPNTTLMSTPSSALPSSPIQNVMALGHFSLLKPGAYFIDPDGDDSTPLRVVYEVPVVGWSQWIGAAKFSDVGHVGVSITTVSNLVTDGCRDHSWADPPVGPSVDDLATALAHLSPFRVTAPPNAVTIYGYSAKHLKWTVPNLPTKGTADERSFTECSEYKLKSWVAFVDKAEPGDAFYGYSGPGYVEEFWILNVEGTRLMIVAGSSPGSRPEDLTELQGILESIRIEP